MRFLAGLLLALCLASGLGLWVTWLAMERPMHIGSLQSGPWISIPDRGGPEPDPYERATVARDGLAPVPASDATTFTATRDSEGRRLRAACDYVIAGNFPAARVWTLTAYDPAGGVPSNIAARNAVDSGTLVRTAGEGTVVNLAFNARPGNWLPLPESGPLVLMLRLYDPTGLQAATGAAPTLPAITRADCR